MTSPTQEADRRAIDALRAKWVAAIAERNADALRDLLTDDYEVWANAAPPIVGAEAAIAAMREAVERYRIDQRFDPIETVIAGDWAFERGIETMTVTPLAGDGTRTMSQRALLVMRRGPDGRWRYARGMTNAAPATPPSGAS